MIFKFLNMTWDLKPILEFIWIMIPFFLFACFWIYAKQNNVFAAMGFALGCALWTYISHTIEANKKEAE